MVSSDGAVVPARDVGAGTTYKCGGEDHIYHILEVNQAVLEVNLE